MKNEREVTDPKEVSQILGQEIETPDDQPVPTGEAQPKTEVTTEVREEEPEVQAEVTTEAEPKEAEEKRRTWQSEADKAKADNERLQSELQQNRAIIAALQGQNQQLTSMFETFNSKYGVQEEKTGPPEPNYTDEFDNIDPRKLAQWQTDREKWIIQQARNAAVEDFQKAQEQKQLADQLAMVAQEFPQYVNPLTGQVDTERLRRDVEAYTGKKGLVELVREMTDTKPTSSDLQKSLEKIDKNANKPSSVVDAQEVDKTPQKIDPELAKIFEAGGYDTWETPG